MDVVVVRPAHRIRMHHRDPKPRETRPVVVPLPLRHHREHHLAVDRARKFHWHVCVCKTVYEHFSFRARERRRTSPKKTRESTEQKSMKTVPSSNV
jgi:hypothetical protein